MSERVTKLHTCTLCEAMCGLEIHVEDDRVALIRPDREDVWSHGYICPKGTTLGRLHDDPDRLRQPVVRDGTSWREVSWSEAFQTCERLLQPVIEKYGIGAVTAYVGNPTAHNFSLSRYVGVLIAMSGIPMIYSSGTVDQWPKNLSCLLMYGNMWTFPVPDVPRTDLWVIMGANPEASKGSLLACPDLLGQIDRIREAGGRTIVVDPRRTGTADRADEWIPIVPGTDAALLMAVVHVLFAEGLVDLGGLGDVVNGVSELADTAGRSRPRPCRTRVGCRPSASAVWPTSWLVPSGPCSTAASGCATRSSAPWRRGSSTWSTSSLATSTCPVGSCSPTRWRGACRACREPTRPAGSRPADGAVAYAGLPRLWVKCPSPAWPRRSTHPARAS